MSILQFRVVYSSHPPRCVKALRRRRLRQRRRLTHMTYQMIWSSVCLCSLFIEERNPLVSTQLLSPDMEPAAPEESCNLKQKPRQTGGLFIYLCITVKLCWFVTWASAFVFICLCFICIHMWGSVNFCDNLSGCILVCVCVCEWTGLGPGQVRGGGCCCLAGCPVASALVWSVPTDPVDAELRVQKHVKQHTAVYTPGRKHSTPTRLGPDE